jgi:hypothetical protein
VIDLGFAETCPEPTRAFEIESRFFFWSCVVSWDRPFDQPVPMPSGPPARTLRDAAGYMRKLPKSEHDTPEWRLVVQTADRCAEDRGPMMFAKMGITQAINRNDQRVFNPDRKDPYWGRRKLKRDT